MMRYRTATICISSVIAVGIAVMCHELAHVLAGRLAGGSPTLMTATEVKGDFDSLSPAGFVALGASGSVINLIFCLLGSWVLSRRPIQAEVRLTAFFFFAVNGMLLTTTMMAETLAGFGDWMTILHPFPAVTPLRVMFALVGIGGVVFMVRRSGAELSRLVPPGEPPQRMAEAGRILWIGAAAASVLVVGGSVANPVGTTRGVLLALGAALGPFIPMSFGLRFVRRIPPKDPPSMTTLRGPWLLAGAFVVSVMWFIVGPGITLPG